MSVARQMRLPAIDEGPDITMVIARLDAVLTDLDRYVSTIQQDVREGVDDDAGEPDDRRDGPES
jgi:hypothetical protein